MRRVFTYGCSYTSYSWPTWADWLAADNPEVRVYNMGFSGIGNQAIAMMRHASEHIFGSHESDLHLCLWTSFDRMDHYNPDIGWYPSIGSITAHEFLPEILDVLWSEPWAHMFNSHLITTTPMDHSAIAMLYDSAEHDEHNKTIPNFTKTTHRYPDKWLSVMSDIDGHPSPIKHWAWYEENIRGKFNLTSDGIKVDTVLKHQRNLEKVVEQHRKLGPEAIRDQLCAVHWDWLSKYNIVPLEKTPWFENTDEIIAHYRKTLRGHFSE